MMIIPEPGCRQKDKISVIIPVYNTASFLTRCINSVLKQTYRNTEIILVDDGSTDESPTICDKYAELYDVVTVLHQENAGVSAARNAGIEYASGEYITFIDSDDWVHCRCLEALYLGIKKTNAQICVIEQKKCNMDYDEEVLPSAYLDFQILSKEQLINIATVKRYIWGRLFHYNVIKDIRFSENLSIGEDTAFNLDIYCGQEDLKVAYSSVQLYYYYQRTDSATHSVLHTKIYKVGEYYLERIKKFSPSWGRNVMLLEAMKAFFAARYRLMFSADQQTNRHIREMIRYTAFLCLKEKKILMRERLLYLTFAIFPFTYRVFRILNDPTMLQWEKSARAKQKEKLSMR